MSWVRVRVRVRVRVSKLDEIEEENYVTQRDVIRELSSYCDVETECRGDWRVIVGCCISRNVSRSTFSATGQHRRSIR